MPCFPTKGKKYPSKSPANTCLSHKQPLATHQIPSFSTIPENWIPVPLDPGEITGHNYPHILNIHLRYVN